VVEAIKHKMLQNTLSSTGLSRGTSFFLLLDISEPPHLAASPLTSHTIEPPLVPTPRRLIDALFLFLSFVFLCLPMMSSFLLSFDPCCPRRSALSVLLFYCGTPRCRLVSSVSPDLRLFRYLAAHCCALRMLLTSLLRTLFSDWLFISQACPYSITDSAAEFQPHYIYSASHCNVSLVSSTQSSVVAILTPRREPPLERLLVLLVLDFVLPSHSRATGP